MKLIANHVRKKILCHTKPETMVAVPICPINAPGGGGGSAGCGFSMNGASGGGGSGQACPSLTGGLGTSPYGYNGGNGYGASTYGGGGDGGSSEAGVNGTNGQSGRGGNGTSNSISGSSVTYAGGGGAGWTSLSSAAGAGGSGGGGGGGASAGAAGTNGTDGSGGGGGGSGMDSNVHHGGNGGSGVVIVSYHSDGTDGVSASSTGGTITTSGGYHIHSFTSSGTFGAVGTGYSTGTNPTITLTGSNLMDLNVGDSWNEPGYSATDPLYGNITASTTVTGSVNTSTAGTYQLTYNVTNVAGVPAAGIMRTVVVHKVNTNPTVTLTGSNLINLDLGESFTEPGYSATDTEDGNITSSVTITGIASTFKAGTYHLIYNVLDSDGAPAAGIVRTIVVHPTFNSLQNLAYSYDSNGNITEIIDGSTISTARGVNYTYDDLNRLTGATIYTESGSFIKRL